MTADSEHICRIYLYLCIFKGKEICILHMKLAQMHEVILFLV